MKFMQKPQADGSNDALGHVVSVTGSRAVIAIDSTKIGTTDVQAARVTVGNIVSIHTGSSRVLAMISGMTQPVLESEDSSARFRMVEVELVGEIKPSLTSGEPKFDRGLTVYPTIGDLALCVTSEELTVIHSLDTQTNITVGQLQQDHTIPARIDVDEMLSKHFAVLGTTGVGKSCAVALLLRKMMNEVKSVRMFMIDPHSEYRECFGDMAEIISPNNVTLPFWLFNFEEIADVFFKARPGSEIELEILSELIPIAKARYSVQRTHEGSSALRRMPVSTEGYTVDTPVPYRISDLLSLIDDRMGKLDNRLMVPKYKRLKARIEAVSQDPRYIFMFNNITVEDTMVDVLSRLFRIPMNGRPITIMELAGFPAEVVDPVVSVLCRMAFDFGMWSQGKVPIAVVCEEAHRYVPADPKLGFGPTRRSISRIAKEGRKYGVFIGVITQRPAELDPTILSQCSTLFCMRMANEHDQDLVRSAVSDAASSLLEFLPAMGTREAIAFGEGVSTPMRLRFENLAEEHLPRSRTPTFANNTSAQSANGSFVDAVINRWRDSSKQHNQTGGNEAQAEPEAMDGAAAFENGGAPAPAAPDANHNALPSNGAPPADHALAAQQAAARPMRTGSAPAAASPQAQHQALPNGNGKDHGQTAPTSSIRDALRRPLN